MRSKLNRFFSRVLLMFLLAPAFAVLAAPVPLHRLYADSTTDYFYTTSDSDVAIAVQIGFAYQGVVGYCEPYGAGTPSGTINLARFYAGTPTTDHFYTTDPFEIWYVETYLPQYTFERYECQLSATQTPGTSALHRMTRNWGADVAHFYTTSWSEIYQKQSEGYVYEAVMGYILDSPQVYGVGFGDNGFYNPKARTEYPAAGIPAAPGSFVASTDPNCLTFQGGISNVVPAPECPAGIHSLTFANNNAWEQYLSSWTDPNYWVVVINNEPRSSMCNSGPPDASLPIGPIGGGNVPEVGLAYTYGLGWVTQLGLNFSATNPCNVGGGAGTPYLSFGAQYGHGNPFPISYLNPGMGIPSRLKFTASLPDYSPAGLGTVPKKTYMRLLITAKWDDAAGRSMNRHIFINLFSSPGVASDEGARLGWSWPYLQSFFYPGGEMAVFDAVTINSRCAGYVYIPPLQAGDTNVSYSFDINRLFMCANALGWFSNPIPASVNSATVTGVHWSVEGLGDSGHLRVGIANMQISQ